MLNRPGVAALSLCFALLVACGTRSVELNAEGTRGGDCRPDGTCDLGLECFRGVCVPLGEDDAGTVLPPPPNRDGGAGERDGGGTVIPTDGGHEPTPTDLLVTGDGALVAVFPTPAGILVIDQAVARLVDRSGAELARFEPGREITAAAFDGTRLGVADRAKLTVLQPDLASLGEVILTQWCASAVIVSGARFVCGPENDWDRIFTTYDMVGLGEIAMSEPQTYAGIPMTRVPGTDAYITVSGGSPSDFHLYRVLASGAAEFLGESPYHGDFPVQNVFSFIGDPATHVVTHEGLYLEIFAAGCDTPTSGSDQDCFVRDGDLGSLPIGGAYALMARDADGYIYGLHDPTDRFFGDPYCDAGCAIHRVDPTSRSIASNVMYTEAFLAPVVMAHDATSSRLVLGAATEGDRFDGYTAYEVRLVAYE